MARARKIQRFLSQPFHVAEQFTGFKGKYVKLADTIRGFKEIVEGKHDDIPEQAFYMQGTIEDVHRKGQTAGKLRAYMADTFLLQVVSPERILVEEQVTRCRFPRSTGSSAYCPDMLLCFRN